MKHSIPSFEKGKFGFIDVPFSLIVAGNLEDDLCDDLVDFYETDTYFKKTDGYSGNKVDKKIKDSIDKSIVLNCEHETIKKYKQELDYCAYRYAKVFPPVAQVNFTLSKTFNIQKYPKGGGYFEWHSERLNNSLDVVSRILVFMTYLNDIEDGGETEFLMQNLSVKPKKGLTLIWPSEWSHTHRGIPSPTEEKIIATGWFEIKAQSNNRNTILQEILQKEELAKVA